MYTVEILKSQKLARVLINTIFVVINKIIIPYAHINL